MALKNVRQAMIDAGRSRKLINKDVNRIRGMFGWAVEHELCPVEVHQALRRVKGLRKGRSAARETAPVEPVRRGVDPRRSCPTSRPRSPRWSSSSTSAAPGRRRSSRSGPARSTPTGDVWLYRPRGHKTEHLDRGKVIMLGPKAQEVLRPWLDRDPEAYCFVPGGDLGLALPAAPAPGAAGGPVGGRASRRS